MAWWTSLCVRSSEATSSSRLPDPFCKQKQNKHAQNKQTNNKTANKKKRKKKTYNHTQHTSIISEANSNLYSRLMIHACWHNYHTVTLPLCNTSHIFSSAQLQKIDFTSTGLHFVIPPMPFPHHFFFKQHMVFQCHMPVRCAWSCQLIFKTISLKQRFSVQTTGDLLEKEDKYIMKSDWLVNA